MLNPRVVSCALRTRNHRLPKRLSTSCTLFLLAPSPSPTRTKLRPVFPEPVIPFTTACMTRLDGARSSASKAGHRAVVSTAWEEVTTQIVETSLGESSVERNFGFDSFAARWLAQRARTGVERLYVQHLNAPDAAGHSTGFSLDNPRYIEAIESCDQNLGVLVDAVLARATVASEDWLFVLTTDHGGRGTTHGPLDDDNRRIWFVASGPSIAPATIATGASHMDTAPTVLEWLGVTIDPSWGLQGVSRAR
jgi:hypothetical protein